MSELKKIDYIIYVIIEDKPFICSKDISIKLKLDKALISKSLSRLMKGNYILRTKDKPFRYKIKQND